MSFPLLPEYLRNRYHYEPSEDAELLQTERTARLRAEALKDNANIAERARLENIERQISQKQLENKADELRRKIRRAESDMKSARLGQSSPGRRSPKDFEKKILSLERDIRHYDEELREMGFGRQ